MAKTLQYWGTGNFQEHPYTGRIVTWTEKEKQTVDDAIATKLLAANAGFVLDNDESGEVVTSQINSVTGGIEYLRASDADVRPMRQAGYRTVLFADSMTDYNLSIQAVSAAFDPATKRLTVTKSGHGMPVGQQFGFWNRGYQSVNAKMYLTVLSVTSANVFVAQLPDGDYSDLPTGTLIGQSYAVPDSFGCAKSWLQWVNAMLGQRFNIVANCAQSGDTTAQVLARIDDVLAYKPQLVIMQMPGVNDLIYDSVGGRNDFAGTVANLTYIFDMFRTRGIRMIVGTITPVATGEVRAQKNIMLMVQRLNQFLWNYSRLHGGMLVVDPYQVVINPTDASGLARPELLAAADFIHYNNVGGYRIAKAIKSAIATAFPSQLSTLPVSTLNSQANAAFTSPTAVAVGNVITVSAVGSYVEAGQEFFVRGATGAYATLNGRQVALSTDFSGTFRFASASPVPDGSVTGTLVVSPSRQLFPDPLLQVTTGGTVSNGVTGTAAGQLIASNAAGNTGTLTAVASVASAASGFGNEQIITVTAAAINDQPRIALKNSVGTIENKIIPGRTYVLEALLRVSSTNWANTPISEIFFEMNIGANGGETWSAKALHTYEAVAPLEASGSSDIVLHLKTNPLTIPSGATSLDSCQCEVRVRYQGAQSIGSLVVGLSQIAVNDVTPDYNDHTLF